MVPASGGGAARQITFGPRGDSQPQWSPDGRYISFVSARGNGAGEDGPKPQVFVMRADGGEARRVTDAKEGVVAYSWAPDSRRLAFVATDPRSNEEPRRSRRKTMSACSKAISATGTCGLWRLQTVRQRRASPKGAHFTLAGDPPSWSPEGSRLVFSANVTTMLRDERQDVYIADIASRQITKISTNFGRDSRPQWSPDGAAIAWVMDPNTAKPNGDGTPAGVVAAVASRDLRRQRTQPEGRGIARVRSRSGCAAVDSEQRSDHLLDRRARLRDRIRLRRAERPLHALTDKRTLQLGSQSSEEDDRRHPGPAASPMEVYVTERTSAR